MSSKTQLELNVDITNDSHKDIKRVRLRKYVEANFVPQHGMEIVDSGVIFQVKTIALAGLSGLKHVAFPSHITENRHLFSRTREPNEKWLSDLVNQFKNQGWSVTE